MLPTLRRKLEALAERRDELERLLADPAIAGDQSRFRALSREFSRLAPLSAALADEARARADLEAAEAMRADPELRGLAEDEVEAATARLAELDETLMALLVPRDARDDGGIYLEVRAGTGGDEAAIFAGDLLRMYTRYAERQGWRIELESASPGEHGGVREAVARIEGSGVYARLKFESGTHRVQRVPETESQGRIHTSAATVAIIPVEEDGEPIEINPVPVDRAGRGRPPAGPRPARRAAVRSPRRAAGAPTGTARAGPAHRHTCPVAIGPSPARRHPTCAPRYCRSSR